MRARELARAAQFMREWSSGAQTDFTNYAARRLAERGLLREDDPIKLQRAVTDIAYAYARGGNVESEFVPADEALLPSRPLPELLRWPSQSLRGAFEPGDGKAGTDSVRGQAAANDGSVRARQDRQGVEPRRRPADDLSPRVVSTEERITKGIESRRRELAQNAGALSEDYNAAVTSGKISPHHDGNRAVWDTVGAQTENRASLGTPPERPTIGEWHFDKDGVPVAGPGSDPVRPAERPNPSNSDQGAGKSAEGKDKPDQR